MLQIILYAIGSLILITSLLYWFIHRPTKKKLKLAQEALEFYGAQVNYDYVHPMPVGNVPNDMGRKARNTLLLLKTLVLMLSITTALSVYRAAIESYWSFTYRRGYEAFQNEHEAFVRTLGRPVNTAFTCKLK